MCVQKFARFHLVRECVKKQSYELETSSRLLTTGETINSQILMAISSEFID